MEPELARRADPGPRPAGVHSDLNSKARIDQLETVKKLSQLKKVKLAGSLVPNAADNFPWNNLSCKFSRAPLINDPSVCAAGVWRPGPG